jgi:hypothetical protein
MSWLLACLGILFVYLMIVCKDYSDQINENNKE